MNTAASRAISATTLFFELLALGSLALVCFVSPSDGVSSTSVLPDVRFPLGGLVVGAWLTWRILRWADRRNGKALFAGLLALLWVPGVWVTIRLALIVMYRAM